jgi:hypothetical protein
MHVGSCRHSSCAFACGIDSTGNSPMIISAVIAIANNFLFNFQFHLILFRCARSLMRRVRTMKGTMLPQPHIRGTLGVGHIPIRTQEGELSVDVSTTTSECKQARSRHVGVRSYSYRLTKQQWRLLNRSGQRSLKTSTWRIVGSHKTV